MSSRNKQVKSEEAQPPAIPSDSNEAIESANQIVEEVSSVAFVIEDSASADSNITVPKFKRKDAKVEDPIPASSSIAIPNIAQGNATAENPVQSSRSLELPESSTHAAVTESDDGWRRLEAVISSRIVSHDRPVTDEQADVDNTARSLQDQRNKNLIGQGYFFESSDEDEFFTENVVELLTFGESEKSEKSNASVSEQKEPSVVSEPGISDTVSADKVGTSDEPIIPDVHAMSEEPKTLTHEARGTPSSDAEIFHIFKNLPELDEISLDDSHDAPRTASSIFLPPPPEHFRHMPSDEVVSTTSTRLDEETKLKEEINVEKIEADADEAIGQDDIDLDLTVHDNDENEVRNARSEDDTFEYFLKLKAEKKKSSREKK